MSAWSEVTVGVADLDSALALWVETFGFEIEAQRDGASADRYRAWGLEDGSIVRQAVLSTPGATSGRLHLVEYAFDAPAIRDGAAVFDSVPKNLDVYVDDLPRRFAEMRAAGHTFRNENYSEVTAPNDIRFREIHLPAHDEVNVVLLEVIGKPLPFTAEGFAGIGPLISIVDDAAAEKAFFRDVFALELLSDNLLEGPEIERMVGLPAGAALDVSIWGRAGQPLGQVEIIDYRGTDGADLYPRAVPGARGIFQIGYRVGGLDHFRRRLDALGIDVVDNGPVASLVGDGKTLTFRSPAGLRIEVRE